MHPRNERILSYALVTALATVGALTLAPGARGTPDSTNYLNAARHLVAGHGFVTGTLEWGATQELAPLAVFPPGFSLAIAALLMLGLDASSALACVMGLSYVAYALASCALLRVALPNRLIWSAPILTSALIVQQSVSASLNMALSDLLGAAAVLAVLAWSLRLRSPPVRRAHWVGMALGLCVWIRWANLYLAIGLMLALYLLNDPQGSWRQRLAAPLDLAWAMVFALSPLWARNLALTGTLMGPRAEEPSSPIEHIGPALRGASAWFEHAHAALHSYPKLALAHGAMGLALSVIAWLAVHSTEDRKAKALWLVALTYGLLMVLSRSTVLYDSLGDPRFWLPVLPLCIAAWIRSLATASWPRSAKLAAAAAWLVLLVHTTLVSGAGWVEAASGPHAKSQYFGATLDASEGLRRALALHDAGACRIATNDEFALLPRIGTRPLRMVRLETLPNLATYRGPRLCLVLIGAPTLPHTLRGDYAEARRIVRALSAQGVCSLEQVDDLGELWLTELPPGSTRLSQR